MATKSKGINGQKLVLTSKPKTTSIGQGRNSRPKRGRKKMRGQGKG